jgi:hypothetical protein
LDDLDKKLLNEFYSGPNLFTVTATLHEAQLTNQPTHSLTAYSFTQSLASWESVMVEKLSVSQPAKKFLAFYEIRRFIAVFSKDIKVK